MQARALIAVATVLTFHHIAARAQEPAAEPPPAAPATPPPASAAPVAQDAMRFRGGISLGGGLEKVSVVSGGMFGVDGRLGVQLNDLFAIYVQPHLSFGSLSGSGNGVGVSGSTGTFAFAAMAEVTLKDRFFGGAGFGYGVLNNPSGPMFQARVGGYPLMMRGEDGIRRRGLMAGVDVRTIFIDGATGYLVIGSIGYEKF